MALVFKFVGDEWEKSLCQTVVLGGMISMNFGLIFLFFVSEDYYVHEEDVKNKNDTNTKIKTIDKNSTIEKPVHKYGSQLWNPALISILIHKVISGSTMMGVRY